MSETVTLLQANKPSEQQLAVNSQEPQTVIINSESPAPSHALRRSFPDTLRARAVYDHRQNQLVTAGIICDNAHDLLKRTDSAPMWFEASDSFVKGDYTSSVSATSVVLKPGHNEFQLMMKVETSCSVHSFGALFSHNMMLCNKSYLKKMCRQHRLLSCFKAEVSVLAAQTLKAVSRLK